MLLLGLDIGSSSVKAAVLAGESGRVLASAFYPPHELAIQAPRPGWAEQDPTTWWDCVKTATQAVLNQAEVKAEAVGAIGISYQMHGLVVLDENHDVLRPSIIWCDSRAVETGQRAFEAMGAERALSHLLNSPGNFTASKLRWVRENEPDVYRRIRHIMLPGDYIALRLTGEIHTTISGLSEGIFWDFKDNRLSDLVLEQYDIDPALIPDTVPTFAEQGRLQAGAAQALGLPAGIPVSYRAGDQPNNALSLNVLRPGDIAATAGTSGVVYGVSEEVRYDPASRVNTFAHVNHGADTRLGILLCVNGTGILNSWLKHQVGGSLDYPAMNTAAEAVPIGSDGLLVMPFGNGAERVLENRDPGASVHGLQFNRHGQGHLFRAAQEGIVFALYYGMEIMADMGISPQVIRAGQANMFLSPIFRETLASLSGAPIELYNTDGAQGAARGAGLGVGYYRSFEEAFRSLRVLQRVEPDLTRQAAYQAAYGRWRQQLLGLLAS
ncbi:MAG: carbohydrate kinase [Bacteroidetes bacterium]|nr:MAG: carbohydrate kinase [Bacteroidota bacterium]